MQLEEIFMMERRPLPTTQDFGLFLVYLPQDHFTGPLFLIGCPNMSSFQ